MKKFLYITVLFSIFSCGIKPIKTTQQEMLVPGIYELKNGFYNLELKADGTYVLLHIDNPYLTTYVCDVSSKGKWNVLGNETLEILSEDHYLKEQGFYYKLNLENKLSQDSIYIDIKFPEDFLYYYGKDFISNGLILRHSTAINTSETFFKVKKSDYISGLIPISLSIYSNTSGTINNLNRGVFNIFDEKVDTDKYNYLTVELPHFDPCFFEFVPYNHELLYIKDKNTLIWKGEEWVKR